MCSIGQGNQQAPICTTHDTRLDAQQPRAAGLSGRCWVLCCHVDNRQSSIITHTFPPCQVTKVRVNALVGNTYHARVHYMRAPGNGGTAEEVGPTVVLRLCCVSQASATPREHFPPTLDLLGGHRRTPKRCHQPCCSLFRPHLRQQGGGC